MPEFFTKEELERLPREPSSENGPAEALRRRIRESGRPVYFFGAKLFGAAYYDYCQTNLLPDRAAGVLDNDPTLTGQTVAGMTVHRPDDPEIMAARPFVVILAGHALYRQQMGEQCGRLGYPYLTTDAVTLSHTGSCGTARVEDDPEAAAALNVWEDEASRAMYRSVLRASVTLDEADLLPAETRFRQYFHSRIGRDKYRFFVDAGAYNGDTLRNFRQEVGDQYEAYYAFEPGAEAFSQLLTEAGNDARVRCREEILLDRRALVPFQDLGFAGTGSRVMAGGSEKRADRLDSLLADSPVTCIKMDIEGGELLALEGARGIVQAQRPILAVCTYHEVDHNWRIPLWIKRLVPSYRLFFTRHGPGLLETVCYAVPDSQC